MSAPASVESASDAALAADYMTTPDFLVGLSLAEMREHLERDLQTPIDFHGQVVDRDGNPVAGAIIEVAVYDHLLEPFELPYFGWTELPQTESGADGRFTVAGHRGIGLQLRVWKAGWKSVGHGQRIAWYAPETRHLNEDPLPTAAEPTRFVIAPSLDAADTLLVRSGAVLLPRDGSEIEYRLGGLNPNGVEPGEGDLAMACSKGPVRADGRWDWHCRVRMTKGGVQPRHDLVVDEAPQDGYRSSYEFGMTADDPDWDHRGEKLLYVMLGDGPVYGYLDLKVRTAGDFYFDVHGFVNVTGSRQLDYVHAAHGMPIQ